MADVDPNTPLPPPPTYGTSLVDRMNVLIHLRKYIRLAIKRWFILAVCFFACAGAAVYYAKTAPDIYRATSRLGSAIKFKTGSDSLEPTAVENLRDYAETQLSYMQSGVLRGRILNRLQEDYPNGFPGAFPEYFKAVAEEGTGSTFDLIVEYTDPEFAKKYASYWVDEFLKYKEELKADSMEGSVRRKQELLKSYQNKFVEARSNIIQTQEKFPQVSAELGPSLFSAKTNILEDMIRERARLEADHMALKSMTAEDILSGNQTALTSLGPPASDPTAAGNTNAPPTLIEAIGNEDFNQLTLQLRSKENQLERYASVLKPAHPLMVKLRNDIEELRQTRELRIRLINEQREKLIALQEEKLRSLSRSIDKTRSELEELVNVKYYLDQLKEDQANFKQQVNVLKADLEAMSLAPLEEDSFQEIYKGVGSSSPVGPQRVRIVIMGVLAGLSLGFGLIYLLNRLDDRLELAEDIERELEEPVLGQIPLLDRKLIGKEYILISDLGPHNMFCEAIRGVRSAVKFGHPGRKQQVLLVTSAVPGDGKTTFTVNFAATLAAAGQRVLLIDSDLRRGTTCFFFGHPRDPGLTEILTGELHWMDVLNESPIPNLDAIHSGRLATNPGELLLSPIVGEFLAEVRNHYEYIIIDCPPLTAIDDTFSLMNQVDASLFVVRAGQTSMRFAKNSLLAAAQRGAEIIGIVLNGITTSDPGYYYAKYYHSYYNKDLPSYKNNDNQAGPAFKMASPKTVRFRPASIDEAAKAHAAGHPVTSDAMAKPRQKKSLSFKERRAVRKGSEK